MKRMFNFCLVGVYLSLSVCGCLKTRNQLREDLEEREALKPVAVQPAQDVQPQGQYVIEELKEEITRMSGRLEDLERTQKDLLLKARTVDSVDLKKLEGRIFQLEEKQVALTEILKKVEESSSHSDPNQLLRKAKSEYGSKNYEAAAQSLDLYLKNPKAPATQEAVFLRGECYFYLKHYKKAIVEYSKFPEKYPKSQHMAQALYKIGLSFDRLGLKEDAEGFYQELIEKYPQSLEAKKFRKK